jgi:hypothetical protein
MLHNVRFNLFRLQDFKKGVVAAERLFHLLFGNMELFARCHQCSHGASMSQTQAAVTVIAKVSLPQACKARISRE